nr:hypothetical protein GCM10020093_107830 [Planobispora longispora]
MTVSSGGSGNRGAWHDPKSVAFWTIVGSVAGSLSLIVAIVVALQGPDKASPDSPPVPYNTPTEVKESNFLNTPTIKDSPIPAKEEKVHL